MITFKLHAKIDAQKSPLTIGSQAKSNLEECFFVTWCQFNKLSCKGLFSGAKGNNNVGTCKT